MIECSLFDTMMYTPTPRHLYAAERGVPIFSCGTSEIKDDFREGHGGDADCEIKVNAHRHDRRLVRGKTRV